MIIFFPTTSPKSKNCIWISYNNVERYVKENDYTKIYFKGGKVYICDEETIDSIRDDSTRDIYVVDGRNAKDPNMRICNSYEVLNPFDMRRLLNILLEYEKEYPSEWNRTLISMIREWLAHNACYYSDVETHRTAEVDLNNADENQYLVLKK